MRLDNIPARAAMALPLALLLCACGPAQVPHQAASPADLDAIGSRNDEAATRAAIDQRAASAASGEMTDQMRAVGERSRARAQEAIRADAEMQRAAGR